MSFPDPPSFADADDTDALMNPFEELAADLRGGGDSDDGADNSAENGINDLSERASGIIDSYRDFIHGREDLEMNMTRDRLPPASGRGIAGRIRSSAEIKDSDLAIGDGPSVIGFGGQDNSPMKRGEPLLRDWNNSPAARSRCELDIDEIWNNDDDDVQKKNYRYTHPIYHSKKFKRLVIGAVGVAAIVGLIAMASKSSHENSLPDWDEELKEVLEEEGIKSDEDHSNEISEMRAADSMMEEVFADKAAMEMVPAPPIDTATSVTKTPSNLNLKASEAVTIAEVINLDLFCGTCEWEKAPFDCDTRIKYLVDTYNMAEKDAKEITLKDGDCIDPEKDEDLHIQVVKHAAVDDASPKEDAAADEVQESEPKPESQVQDKESITPSNPDPKAAEAVVVNLDLFCGTCGWEKAPIDCNTRIKYLVDHYNMAEKDAKETTLKDGDCIDPEKDEDLHIQAVTHAAADDAAADEVQESEPKPESQVPDKESITPSNPDPKAGEAVVVNLDLFCGTCGWEKAPIDCNTRIKYLVDTYNMAEKNAKETTLKDGDCIAPEKDEDLNIQAVTNTVADDAAPKKDVTVDEVQESEPKPESQVQEKESITRNVMCCSPSGGFPNMSISSTNTAEQTSVSSDLIASEYAAAESHHPVWYDRTTGWVGTTYREALEFCSSKVDSTSKGGVETKKQLCPYNVYCPTGPHHMPLGGYRGEGFDGDASPTSRSPISDYPDGWVQVDKSHSCIQHTIFDVTDGNGVADVAKVGETGAAAILDEIVEKNAAGAKDDDLVEETYVPVNSHAKPTALQQHEPSDTVTDSVNNEAEGQPEDSAQQQQQGEEQKASQQQEQSKETIVNPIIVNNAQQHAEIDMTSILRNKFKPLWLSSEDGWAGGSHAEAAEFCTSIRGKNLCPYSAMCPQGPGGAVMGGRHKLEFDVLGEQYAPIYGKANHWVMIGTTDEGGNKCMTHRQLEGKSPEWGLNSERKEVKQHIMCCTVE